MGPDVVLAIAAVVLLLQPPAVDRVVLLPGADGRVGAVSVKTAGGERLLDRAYAGAAVDARGGIETRLEDAAEVRQRYASALAAQPLPAVFLVVNFVSATDEMTTESLPVLEQVKAEVTRRPAAEIVAIGHTDRVGSDADNDVLALKRAEAVRAALLAAGLAPSIAVAGRGEREPLVPTADEVEEPRNRRVEIEIR